MIKYHCAIEIVPSRSINFLIRSMYTMTEIYIHTLLIVYMSLGTAFALTAIPEWYTAMTFMLMCKWIFDYRKCTLSYIEIKLRHVKKERGYLFKLVGDLVDFRQDQCIQWMYLFQILVLTLAWIGA